MKTIWIIIISVVVAGGLIGGGTYYLVNAKATKDKNELSSKLHESEKQSDDKQINIDDLSSKLSVAEMAVTANKNQTAVKVLTHTNDLGKFSFDLPDGYIVSKSGSCEGRCGETLSVSKLDNGISHSDMAIIIRSVDYSSPITLENWNKDSGYSPISEIGDVSVGGVSAKKYFNGGLFGVEEIRFTRGNFTYEIIKEERADAKKQKAAYDKIISTFKFTD